MNLTIGQVLARASTQLRQSGIADAAIDARWLLADALNTDRGRLLSMLPDPMPPVAAERFASMLAARVTRQPIAQIIGHREFWGRRFRVTPDVLDPRPDTETLIAAALELPFGHVLDLGTGSGIIAITVLAENPTATAVAADISPAALAVARQNAADLGVLDRLTLVQSDWFGNVAGQFDLILSNPPYIGLDEWAGLSPEVRDHEPKLALTPGADGAAAYRAIAKELPQYLKHHGHALFEIGYQQGREVDAVMQSARCGNVQLLQDINGRDRVISVGPRDEL